MTSSTTPHGYPKERHEPERLLASRAPCARNGTSRTIRALALVITAGSVLLPSLANRSGFTACARVSADPRARLGFTREPGHGSRRLERLENQVVEGRERRVYVADLGALALTDVRRVHPGDRAGPLVHCRPAAVALAPARPQREGP